MWDTSQAYGESNIGTSGEILNDWYSIVNNRIDKSIKEALVAAGGSGFTYPACSEPAYVPGENYPASSKVSHGG